jgi:nucleoside-diphosphate-sugar epimerase
LQNEIPTLFSDGEQKRDYVYIDDLTEMCNIVMTHEDAVGEIFNVCSGDVYSVNDIYYSIAKLFEVNDPPRYEVPSKFWDSYPSLFEGKYSLNLNRLEKEVLKYSLGDVTKSKKVLGWRTTTNLNDGIKNCVEYAKGI